MYLTFREEFSLQANEVFSYFASPKEWVRLFGSHKPAKKLTDDWYSIPLKNFPMPLVAKNVVTQADHKVRWIFRGFWRGVGEIEIKPAAKGVVIEGFEYITPHGLWAIAPFVEKTIMQKEFERIWTVSWKRLRKTEQNPANQ
jgi:hypothetical protein